VEEVRSEGLASATRLAVETFQKIARLQTRMAVLEDELNMWVSQIPEKDLDAYVRITQRIQEKENEKLEKHKKKLEKRGLRFY
jgi:hypothetical protein